MYQGVAERLWAEPIGNDYYRLENTPFDPSTGLQYRSTVFAPVIDGLPQCTIPDEDIELEFE